MKEREEKGILGITRNLISLKSELLIKQVEWLSSISNCSFNGCLQLFHHVGPLTSTKQRSWSITLHAQKHSLNWVILLSYSLCSLRPVSAAVDNLVREVQSIRKRLEELNERLSVISKTVLPLRLNALQSQRRGNTQLRRLPIHRRRVYARRRPQST